ncbi:glycoside hydrolase family 108 protein [Propionivibrio sp.]|uniref:glycoside hydrolase family 108 protein n=1 Tax=Propionivibrio sp. TaxID=2212460 RepID=UPI003BF455F3
MSRFTECLPHILAFEGGYVNNPADRGGATNKGITQSTYNEHNRIKGVTLESVKDITDSEVEEIYYERYWQACSCDELHTPLDLVLFDSAVQHGVARASKWLQRVVGTIADGKIGDATLFALNQMVRDNRLDETIDRYLAARMAFYVQIVVNDPSQRVFAKGWKNRLAALEAAIK